MPHGPIDFDVPERPTRVQAWPVRCPQVMLGVDRDSREHTVVLRLRCDCPEACGGELLVHVPLHDARFIVEGIRNVLAFKSAHDGNSN